MTALNDGKAEVKRQGKRVAIIAFGAMVTPALEAGEALDATVVDMGFIKPLDKELIREMADSHDLLVTVEEHQVMGGAGSAVCGVLSNLKIQKRGVLLGLPHRFVHHRDSAKLLPSVGPVRDWILKSIQKAY